MRKILVISEYDASYKRLLSVYEALFCNETKELTHCDINMLESSQSMAPMLDKTPSGPNQSTSSVDTAPKMFRSISPDERIHASNCEEIIKFILHKKIDLVVIPHFIYDSMRAEQYQNIIKAIKKRTSVDVLSLSI